jgi:tetratricopeptide (TPR) repeat protein
MSVLRKLQPNGIASESNRAVSMGQRRSASRLPLLLLVGTLLVGAAWWVRSSSWLYERSLRSKDMTELAAIVRWHPDDALAQYYLGKSYYQAGRFAEARDAYAVAAQLDPTSARTYLGLGLTYLNSGQKEEAKYAFERVLKLDSQSSWAQFMLGKIAWMDDDLPTAISHLQRTVELAPHSNDGWYGLGVCYIQMRRYPQAIDALRHALSCQEASPRYHVALGQIFVFRGDIEEGRRHYERALQLEPDYGPACELMGHFYLHKAADPDALDRAEVLLLRATKLDTLHPNEVYFDLGTLYLQKSQGRKAMDALEESLRLDSRDERAYYALANAYRLLGDTRSAAATEQRFLKISKLHVRMQSLEARLYDNARNAPAHLELARTYAAIGLTQRAAAEYAAYLRLEPNATAVAREFQEFIKQHTGSQTRVAHPRDFGLPSLPQG